MTTPETGQPNIIVILTDDHAQWALGCYGNAEVQSPAMDQLAATGARMANAYTPLPVCSPARASFFTGLYPSQHGIHDYLGSAANEQDWIGSETTLPMMLQAAGYQTAFVGKWHCGGGKRKPQPGFDFWANPGGGPHKPDKTRYCMDQALDFIREHRRTDAPFFLFISDVATHSSWDGHDELWVERYRSCSFAEVPDEPNPTDSAVVHYSDYDHPSREETLAQYYAAVSELDVELGRLVDTLDATGLRDDTLLVYTADHGLCLGQHGVWGKGNGTRPLNMFEESIRIPMLLSWPGRIAPQQVRQEPVDLCDLFSTLLDAAGVSQPERSAAGLPYPGHSFSPMLQGDDAPDWKTIQFGEYGYIRMVRTERYKLVRRHLGRPSEFFDLQADPREADNLIDSPDHQAIITELSQQLDRYFAAIEHPTKNGLQVLDIPSHNGKEAWRDDPP